LRQPGLHWQLAALPDALLAPLPEALLEKSCWPLGREW
jgi:hypothetical protein